MQDMKASAEKLRAEADFAEQIARSATDRQKRELYELAAPLISSILKCEFVFAYSRASVPVSLVMMAESSCELPLL
jgi:hypothetical protein